MDFTKASAREIVAAIRDGQTTATEAVQACIARIEEVNATLNAVVLTRYDEARAEAAAADREMVQGAVRGPLHGLPITIAECLDLAGTDSTTGLPARVGSPASSDAPIVARLRAAGAIVLGKTNISQALMFSEADNPVYGRANNPWDPARTPGGSSGGEAAVIAAGGSPLGIGVDFGGGVRVPAHYCGVCALAPSAHRLSVAGANVPLRQEAIVPQPGPMARTVGDLALAMSVLTAPSATGPDWDVPPVPWVGTSSKSLSELRIGYYEEDGFNRPSPALRRAVREAADHLRELGAEIVKLEVPNIYEAMSLYVAMISTDGGAGLARLLGGGKTDSRVAGLSRFGRLPAWLRESVGTMSEMLGQTHLAHLCQNLGRRTVDEYWGLLQERTRYRAEVMAVFQLDAIVCPPHHLAAKLHGSTVRLGPVDSYTMLFSLLGMPAGVVPITRVGAQEQGDRPPKGGDLADRASRDCERDSAGLPVGVQVAAPPWGEPVVLRVMQELEARFLPDDPGSSAIL